MKTSNCRRETVLGAGFALWYLGVCFLLPSVLAAAQKPVENSLEPLLAKAAAFIQQGKYQEARRELLGATQVYPDSAEAFALLGAAEIQLKDHAAARTSLQHA